MLRGFTVSALVHASVLAMAMISWPQADSECDKAIEKLRRENPGIRAIEIVVALPQCASVADLPIDFEDVGLVSNVSELRKAPEPKEEAVQPEAEPDLPDTPPEAPPEESAPETAVPVPDPRTQPEEVKKPDPKKEPEPKKPEPLIKKEPPKKEPKKDDLDSLLDSLDPVLKDKRQERPRAQPAEATDRPALGNADRDRTGSGERSANTASMQAYVRKEFRTFWPDVTDLPTEDQIEVTVRLKLNEDGTLVGAPELVDPSRRPVGRKGIAVDRALGAARKFFAERRLELPPENYSQWQEIDVVFGADMRGS